MSEDKPLDVKDYDGYAPNPNVESFDCGPLASVSGIEISKVRRILKACNGKTMGEIMDRQMTIDEIMAAEIPEGKYVFAANVIRQALKNEYPAQECIDSLCAAFEALYKLAKEPNGYFYPIADPNEFRRDERRIMLAEVLCVVDEMINHMEVAVDTKFIPVNYGILSSISTINELKRRISAIAQALKKAEGK